MVLGTAIGWSKWSIRTCLSHHTHWCLMLSYPHTSLNPCHLHILTHHVARCLTPLHRYVSIRTHTTTCTHHSTKLYHRTQLYHRCLQTHTGASHTHTGASHTLHRCLTHLHRCLTHLHRCLVHSHRCLTHSHRCLGLRLHVSILYNYLIMELP